MNATETKLLDILRNDKVDEMAEYLKEGSPDHILFYTIRKILLTTNL